MITSLFHPVGIGWLLRLRALAVLGQALTCVGAAVFLDVRVPVAVLAPCLLVTVATNLWATWRLRRDGRVPAALPAGLVMLDTVTLTLMLFVTGGAESPFTVFYLLHVTIAAMVLRPRAAWACVAGAALGYGALFFSPFPLRSAEGLVLGEPRPAYLQGMLVSLVVAGGFLAFFVGKLRAELERREAELAAARLQRVRDERFASLATLAAGVAHELATPLATIAVVAGEMTEAGTDPAADAQLIRAEVERCRDVLRRLSDQATNRSGDEMTPLRLGELPGRLAAFASEAVLSRVDFECAEPERAVVVPTEALLQALAVVVKNGVEASPPGGRVRLRAEVGAGEVTFEVTDRGPGMPAEVSARVGEPFFTTKGPGRGMGLGLFLVRMFAERVHGRLALESTPGAGTTVRLTVPQPEGDEA